MIANTRPIDPWRTTRTLCYLTVAASFFVGVFAIPLWIVTVIVAILADSRNPNGAGSSWLIGTILGLPIVCTVSALLGTVTMCGALLTVATIAGGGSSSYRSTPAVEMATPAPSSAQETAERDARMKAAIERSKAAEATPTVRRAELVRKPSPSPTPRKKPTD